MTPFLDKISQVSTSDLFIQHLGTCNHYKLLSWGSGTPRGLLGWHQLLHTRTGAALESPLQWHMKTADTQAQFKWTEITQKPALNSGPLFPCFPPDASLLPNPGSSPPLCRPSFTAQTCTCAMAFLWNILLKIWWNSTKPHSVFHSSVYFATAANTGC